MKGGKERNFMMYKSFFDTNILAYEFDERESEKRAVAIELINKWRPSGYIAMQAARCFLRRTFLIGINILLFHPILKECPRACLKP